ncbi:MAG: Wzz/FepE/Etk N-terminal domain-containing protein [Synechococcus sp. ELA057]
MASQAAAAPAPADDEIDLGQLAASLRRRWRLIAAVSAGTLALSAVVTLLQKPVWEGEFQIVLADKGGAGGKLAQLAAANPMLAGLAGLGGGGGKDSLETEVKVLESPSVLRPVFDAVRDHKQRAGEDVSELRYEDWIKSSLDVKLEKGTSVLNISYRDKDRALVLPVIEKISRAYQDYSGRDRRRDISNAVAYLNSRIQALAPQAEASMRQAQSYALAHGLGLQDGMPAAAGAGGEVGGIPAGGSVEGARMAATSQVIALRQQLLNARAAGDAVLFQAPQLEANKELYGQYQQVETQLAEKRSRLRDNDPIIHNLERQRSALAATLNRETIALLEGQLATAEARLQSASRPNQVVLRHRELVRKAVRDERILTELENQLQLAQLEQAKQTEPWELISRPTLLDKPVSPRKGRNLALGLLAGLVLGSGAALVAERRSGRVFALDELKAALPGELLAELPEQDDPANRSTLLQLLASGPLAAVAPGSLALIPVGLEPASLAELAQALEAAAQRPVLCSTDLVACRACASQLLVTRSGAATRGQLAELRQQLRLQGAPVAGWLLLRSTTPEA